MTLKPETIQAIHDGLWLVVNGAGTGARARMARPRRRRQDRHGAGDLEPGRQGARSGKTDKDLRDHGWFVFFVPRDNPEIAGAVFVEHGEHGGVTAAPIARHIIETYFAKREGRPLPAPPIKVGDTIGRRRRSSSRPRAGRRRRGGTARADMFERRLYHHIDWLLIGAVLRDLRRSAWR